MVESPLGPFDPLLHHMHAGTRLYRVFSVRSGRKPTEFNPGVGEPARFAFFRDATGGIVPVLYAAVTQEAAVSESILHDVPIGGDEIVPADYVDKAMVGIIASRELRLASFMGLGLRRLHVSESDISATSPDKYGETVLWAKAAHEAGLDGVAWMSHRCNTDVAVALFGDRVLPSDLQQDPGFARVFELGPDRDWLSSMCSTVRVTVRW